MDKGSYGLGEVGALINDPSDCGGERAGGEETRPKCRVRPSPSQYISHRGVRRREVYVVYDESRCRSALFLPSGVCWERSQRLTDDEHSECDKIYWYGAVMVGLPDNLALLLLVLFVDLTFVAVVVVLVCLVLLLPRPLLLLLILAVMVTIP